MSATGRPPSVDALARALAPSGLPHRLLVDVARGAIADGDPEGAKGRAEALARSMLQPVVNATGVLLHTNLGRAPTGVTAPGAPCNLEQDLGTGRRSSRAPGTETLLCATTGAARATVVNNGAAAVLVVLAALGPDRPVIVSRGELVEIGGGFRIPEVIASAGTRLVEVGTTNRTRLSDYETALEAEGPRAVVLSVHRSNYAMTGFTESVPVRELARLGVPVVADIGSGLLDADTPWLGGTPPAWLAGEPAARQTLEAGATVVTFSGDKLLGGPQAGVVAGDEAVVGACRRHPLARALRPGGLVLGTLEQTLLAYLRRDLRSLPFWRMATAPLGQLRARAEQVVAKAGPHTGVVDCRSVPGGGTLPGVELPSVGVAVAGDVSAALRGHRPPVLSSVRAGATVCDLRSVEPADDLVLADALASVATGRRGH